MRRSCLLASLLMTTSAFALPAHHAGTRSGAPAPAAPVAAAPVAEEPHPLLPPQVNLATLYPDIAGGLKTAAFAPKGITPLYTQEDWNAYQQMFAADLANRRATTNELAAKFIAAAEAEKRPGVARLLLVRAVAITYRNAGGWAQAGRALESYRKIADINDLAQVAALWTMTDTLSKYSTTPRPERINCSAIAAKANIQLSLALLNLGQLDGALALIRKITYHEGWTRSDTRLRAQIASARATVNSTASLMQSLRGDFTAVVKNKDENAAFRIYLFAKFVRPSPTVVAELASRKNAAAIHATVAALDVADRNPAEAYAAGEALRKAAAGLSEGVLKQRTNYAAMQYYRVFLRDPANEHERVKLTLAQMQVQNLAADGAHGPIAIRPFDPPPPPSPTAATRPVGLPPRTTRPASPSRFASQIPAPATPAPAAPPVNAPSMPEVEVLDMGTAERPAG